MIKKMGIFFSLLIYLFLISSCMVKDKKAYFNDLIKNNNIENLSYDNLDYFYHYVSGFEDKVGLNYYYFSFDKYQNDFIEQFKSNKYRFYDEEFENFELELMNKIHLYIGNKYDEIEENYKIDFSRVYIYSYFPMIYFKETNELIIIEYILQR